MIDGNRPAQKVVLTTPELAEHLSLYLTPTDLSMCIQVNRCWNQVFIPALWHTVDDSKLFRFDQSASMAERSETMNEMVDKIRTRFSKYGRHIRVLRSEWDIVIAAASVSCIHLKSLYLKPSLTCRINEPETWSAHPGASEAAKEVRSIIAVAVAKEEARRAAGIEAYCADRIAAAETPEELKRLLALFSDKESRAKALTTEEYRFPFLHFLSTFTLDSPETQAIREIKQLPGDLGVLAVGYPPKTERLELDWLLLQDCWRLVASNLGLQKLRMEQMPAFQEREASRKFVHGVLASLKDLQDLSLPACFMDSVDFWSMDKFAPSVESLELNSDCIRWMSNNDPQQQGAASFPENTIRGLRTLTLRFLGPRVPMNPPFVGFPKDSNRGQIQVANFSLFLKRLPDIECLSLNVGSEFRSNPTGASLALTPPLSQRQYQATRLKKLYFRGASCQLGFLLLFLPNLIEVYTDRITVEITDALVTHCKEVEVISQFHDPWFISDLQFGREPPDGVNNLLVHLPALKSLNMIKSYIHVDELVQRPWACLGLEKFRCRIVGLERLNESEEEIYNRISAPGYTTNLTDEELAVLDQFHRCRKQQGQVYDRLASLTKLKVLDLGYENRYPWACKGDNWYEVDGVDYLRYGGPIPDTMELSLDSGLDRLSVLENLEMFGFEGNNHRIGEKELDWMAEKWPKLNLMYGLAEDKLFKIEYDQEKAALREYMQRLKPEVVHDSLFEDCV